MQIETILVTMNYFLNTRLQLMGCSNRMLSETISEVWYIIINNCYKFMTESFIFWTAHRVDLKVEIAVYHLFHIGQLKQLFRQFIRPYLKILEHWRWCIKIATRRYKIWTAFLILLFRKSVPCRCFKIQKACSLHSFNNLINCNS